MPEYNPTLQDLLLGPDGFKQTDESIENHYGQDDYDEEEPEVRLDDGSGHSTSLVPESLKEASRYPKAMRLKNNYTVKVYNEKQENYAFSHTPEEVMKVADKWEKDYQKAQTGESLKEDFQMIQLTPNDQATNIRALIKSCWDSVDQFSMFAQQLNDFGSQMALTTVNTLINDLYIAIGSFEEELSTVDPKSTALDAIDRVQAVAQVAPQVATQMAVQPVMIEKFQLSEDLDEDQLLKEDQRDYTWKYVCETANFKPVAEFDTEEEAIEFAKETPNVYEVYANLYENGTLVTIGEEPIWSRYDESLHEDLDEKPEAQEELEEPIEKELKEVEKYRKEKVKDSLNPDPEDTIEETSDMTMVEDLGKDESYNPKFFESLLKLED